MLDLLLFMIFSTIEYCCIFLLTFRLFSFNTKQFSKEIIFTSLCLTVVSYFLRSLNLGIVDIFIQITLFVLFLRVLFRVHFFYSLVMSYGYIFYVIIQIGLFSALNITHILNYIMSSNSVSTYIIQTLTVLVAGLISLFLKKTDFRFSFVPTSLNVKIQYKGRNLYLLALMIIEIFFLVGSFYYYVNNFNHYFFLIALIFFILAGIVLYLLNKKELSND